MPEQREKDRAREIGSPLQRHSGEKARGLRLSFGSSDLSDWLLCCWPLAAEKLPTPGPAPLDGCEGFLLSFAPLEKSET